jgi:hypothetical protein
LARVCCECRISASPDKGEPGQPAPRARHGDLEAILRVIKRSRFSAALTVSICTHLIDPLKRRFSGM